MTRTLAVLATALILLALAAVPAIAGGGGHGAGACAGFAEGDEVLLRDACLEGTAHFLAEGDDLTVLNEGHVPHDYTAVDGSFGTGTVQPGERATIEAPDAGVYRVYCTLHADPQGRGMAGVLVVGDVGPAAVADMAASAASAAPGGGAGGLLGAPVAAWVAGASALLAAALVGVVAVARRRAVTVAAGRGA